MIFDGRISFEPETVAPFCGRTPLTLAAVFLVITGAEALYNDLGHFGRKPIQAAWLFFVLPALVMNYFGQGALLLSQPTAIENPFFFLFPEILRLPMVVVATARKSLFEGLIRSKVPNCTLAEPPKCT